ncbi:MAG: FAD-dependent oxidoreductase, partial [Spirochaetota bacterium]
MKRFIEQDTKENFDCIVIGGGITGAAVAYEAASRGLNVALLEKNDFGWATSAATSKLIHGGLRYLNYFEFGLVRESLRERRILENIAPNLVYPFPFMIPNYNRLENNRWVLKIGMILYDILSYDKGFTWDKSKKIPMHFTLSKEKALQEEPNIHPEGLTAATVYYDCQSIFPERLTLAFIKSAVEYGAKVANYAEVVNFSYTNNSITGVIVHDKLTNREV